ncbi:MAG TPA: DUF222 domain-containing protein [Sporichthya sp.]|nr:DUF222 domain-containing protein [Sporichthya sp.]
MGELRGLSGHQVVVVLQERYAETSIQRASLLEAVWETVLCDDADSTDRMFDSDEWSADEVRAALGLTRRAAGLLVNEAHAVVHRLPKLHEAMAGGELDPARARVFADWTLELTDEHAQQVVEKLLPQTQLSAPTRLTTGQLADEIKTMAVTLDPDWARRRYEGRLNDRKVTFSQDPEGTASISGQHLPVERVAAAKARFERLARAARRAGDKRPIDHIRADLYLGHNDGTYVGLTDEQILATLLANVPHPEPRPGPQPEPRPEPQPEPERAPESEPQSSHAGVQLRVRLTTLLGLDRYPAELAGWGICHAELARQMVRELGAAQWRYVFTCSDGYLVRTGLLRSRPTSSKQRASSCEAVIEIVVPVGLIPPLFGTTADLTTAIDPALVRSWDAVLYDLSEKLREPETVRLLDPRRRAPGAALRREVTTAIKTCVGSGCRAPARAGDVDHLKDHAKGGDTVKDNLDPVCRHDHRVKTEAGWQLRRVADTFEWTTRLGHVYLVPIPPVLPKMPDPPGHRPEPGRDPYNLSRRPPTPRDDTQHGPPPF